MRVNVGAPGFHAQTAIHLLAPALGAVWLAAAIGKCLHPADTIGALDRVLSAFGAGADHAWPCFRLLVAIEFIIGAALLVGLFRRAALAGSAALLVAFTIWTLRSARGPASAPCGCAVRFTWSSGPATFSEELTRNALLLALTCVLLGLEHRGSRARGSAQNTPGVPGSAAPTTLL